jgi:5'-deoxynucleotidase YfbR-like HD superfamily hydrolase
METNIIKLASTILDFGKVNRQTFHQDGLQPESDTDHTVMLGIIAGSLAKKLYADLDIGLVVQFALVHDLVEVYAGGTPTLMDVGEDFFKEKANREQKALEKLKTEFGENFSWIHTMIKKYEKLDTKEARFIKTLDKILPKLTVILNNAKGINDNKLATKDGAEKTFNLQRVKVKDYTHDMPEMLALWEYFVEKELELIK